MTEWATPCHVLGRSRRAQEFAALCHKHTSLRCSPPKDRHLFVPKPRYWLTEKGETLVAEWVAAG